MTLAQARVPLYRSSIITIFDKVVPVRKSSASPSPLEPIATAVGWLTALFVLVMLLSMLVHQATWGNGPVCTSVSPNDASIFSGPVSLPGLAPGSTASLGSATICANHPGSSLRLAGLLAVWPYTVLWGAFLFRLNGLLKAASEPRGLYSPLTAARLRGLGWLMVGGGLAAGIIESAAKIVIFTRLVHYPGLGWFEPFQLNFSFLTLIIGLALLTLARVMRIGVMMREELDVTV
jgi:hypothetical protein